MSGGGTETPVACEAAQGGGGGGKKRDSLGTPGAAHLIIKGTVLLCLSEQSNNIALFNILCQLQDDIQASFCDLPLL
ncbi:Biogenesis of lysosome-related organelles complex 1 subunit 5 [Microtus ochrogaster]|uniref:Biogenesis of lysosome-related organelles complex 1 subunit 5 n=1 Tax=Microtus ochrogaster TaxID=79684 RepID=A0A8J6KXN4_MICOH|nr:Biogenesis of lysosome-related organelles complex 1 subunit 5 [Microtus ochrogaster]